MNSQHSGRTQQIAPVEPFKFAEHFMEIDEGVEVYFVLQLR
jgi:hypothetical protein